jgi:hypothetical protein
VSTISCDISRLPQMTQYIQPFFVSGEAKQKKKKISSMTLLFREYCKIEFARTLGVIFDTLRNFK